MSSPSHPRRRLVVAAVVAVAALVLSATPASATVVYAIEADRGRLAFGSFGFLVPGTFGNCPVDIDLAGTIDETATTDNIDATLVASVPFVLPPPLTGTYILTMTGTSTGTSRGDLNPTTGVFTGFTFPSATFSVRSLDTTVCTVGSTVSCSGTLNLILAGVFTVPVSSTSTAHANASGTVLTRSSCGLPSSVFITVGTSVVLERHPAFPGDAGMLFS